MNSDLNRCQYFSHNMYTAGVTLRWLPGDIPYLLCINPFKLYIFHASSSIKNVFERYRTWYQRFVRSTVFILFVRKTRKLRIRKNRCLCACLWNSLQLPTLTKLLTTSDMHHSHQQKLLQHLHFTIYTHDVYQSRNLKVNIYTVKGYL